MAPSCRAKVGLQLFEIPSSFLTLAKFWLWDSGLIELIVLNVGLSAGILDTRVFSMFVLEAVVLTFASSVDQERSARFQRTDVISAEHLLLCGFTRPIFANESHRTLLQGLELAMVAHTDPRRFPWHLTERAASSSC